jgi:hypothetical protein
MATTFRNALLALVLVLGLAEEMKAQDRYEYATVIYATYGANKSYSIYITEPNSYKEVDGKLAEGYGPKNYTAINELLGEMSKQGWELQTMLSPSSAPLSIIYGLKRKVK